MDLQLLMQGTQHYPHFWLTATFSIAATVLIMIFCCLGYRYYKIKQHSETPTQTPEDLIPDTPMGGNNKSWLLARICCTSRQQWHIFLHTYILSWLPQHLLTPTYPPGYIFFPLQGPSINYRLQIGWREGHYNHWKKEGIDNNSICGMVPKMRS